jgi:catechol 2,3-dioxygenase-like lactoylglutathione lyase family enzyme
MMLKDLRVHTTLPATDLARARAWYSDKLGLEPDSEQEGGLTYRCRDSEFVIYPGRNAGSGLHTQMGFTVEDIEAEVAALKARGVEFESYPDMPDFDASTGIFSPGYLRAAWFRDSEGNMLGLVQFLDQG